jgi:hypothetical protein
MELALVFLSTTAAAAALLDDVVVIAVVVSEAYECLSHRRCLTEAAAEAHKWRPVLLFESLGAQK